MQHKTDLRELVEALMSLGHNPVAIALCELGRREDGMRVGEFISRYEGLKDGEFLGILSSVLGLTVSSGRVNCNGGVGARFDGLLTDLYAAFAENEAKQELLAYLGVSEMPSPEVFYWKQRLGLLNISELAVVRAFVRLGANSEENGKGIDDIVDEVRKVDSEVEVTASTLAALTGKMPVVKDTDAYHLSIGPWQIFEEAVATL